MRDVSIWQMDVEKDMETQFAEVQVALSKLTNHKHASDEITKIHEMSQVIIFGGCFELIFIRWFYTFLLLQIN